MVIHQLSNDTLKQLRVLLEEMNGCALLLEDIGKQEREAIHSLDSDRLLELADRRTAVHQRLNRFEHECHALLARENIPQEMTLEMLIDLHAGAERAEFQAIRRNLYDRIVRIDEETQHNRLRLLASYNVTSTLLQQMGLSNNENTYSRDAVK